MGFPTRITQTAGQQIAGGGSVEEVLITNLGQDSVTVTLLDGGAAGTWKATFVVPAGQPTQQYPFPRGMEFQKAVYAIVEGGSPDVTIVVG